MYDFLLIQYNLENKKVFSIGNVDLSMPVVLAPMAGVTDFPFREIVRNFGVGLVVSEMVASRAIIEALKNPKVRKRMHFFDSNREKSPVSVQIVGYDPSIMADAAAFNEQLGASIIDINMGCPVKKVVNTDSGAALMKDEKLAEQIISSVVKAVKIPVTVKMRLGWDLNNLNAKNIAKISEDCGVSAVTVHGRTRSQFYEGTANWSAIKDVKNAIKIPLIGNGDVKSSDDAKKLLEQSGADAVMVGRGSYGRPWILQEIGSSLGYCDAPKIDSSIIFETINNHIRMIIEEYGEISGVCLARKHLGWYSKGMFGSAEFRAEVNKSETYKELIDHINNFFAL